MPVAAFVPLAAAGLGAVGSIAGGMIQANAANQASQVQQKQFDQTRADLMPYNVAGQGATNLLTSELPKLTAPITMDEATLRNTPGYQFNLNQGLKSVQNSAAARGLGSSGAALRGAADYATGLADSTYQNQFNNANTNNTNAYNRLMGAAQLGENAAAQTGAYGTQTAAGIAQNTTNAGTAISAGLNGAGNALQNGANNYLGYNFLTNGTQGLYSSGGIGASRSPYGFGYPTY